MSSSTTAYQLRVSQYASVGGLAVLTWDILDNIPEDYRLLFKQQRKLTFPAIIYITSRLGAFAYALTSIILATAPGIGHCATLDLISLSWCPISFGATGLLFFLRLRAVYNRDRIIVLMFFILWLAVLVGEALEPVGAKGRPAMDPGNTATEYCEISLTPLSFYGIMAPLVYDTLVFLAISWRLSRISMAYEPGVNVGKRVNAMFFGTDIPTFTRSLLIDGQIYYLITVIGGVVCTVLLFSPGIPVPLSVILEDAYPALVNIMACRLFRRTKSGVIRESGISSSVVNQRTHLLTIQFAVSRNSGIAVETNPNEELHTA